MFFLRIRINLCPSATRNVANLRITEIGLGVGVVDALTDA